jgi:hypothetical protein
MAAVLLTACEPVEPTEGQPVIERTVKKKVTPAVSCKKYGKNIAGRRICTKWK